MYLITELGLIVSSYYYLKLTESAATLLNDVHSFDFTLECFCYPPCFGKLSCFYYRMLVSSARCAEIK